ncbi:hypothetical protein BD311DRAFT_748342 [Dichomitus squalens]|uniref:Uncharacterized protein n=1 Tax=Dichomitus squalens TaxID=114155 RepID=A0A4Q9MYU7_9APHY|nr:hypothetical protein BD311DRAFT_748342 [Dichomitus squalens]
MNWVQALLGGASNVCPENSLSRQEHCHYCLYVIRAAFVWAAGYKVLLSQMMLRKRNGSTTMLV